MQNDSSHIVVLSYDAVLAAELQVFLAIITITVNDHYR